MTELKTVKDNSLRECECICCHSIWSFDDEQLGMIRADLEQCPLCWKKEDKTLKDLK